MAASKNYTKQDMDAEFNRGYNFGKEDAYQEILREGKYKHEFTNDTVVIVIPREVFIQLRQKASETA